VLSNSRARILCFILMGPEVDCNVGPGRRERESDFAADSSIASSYQRDTAR
jgi:hypothetical protein